MLAGVPDPILSYKKTPFTGLVNLKMSIRVCGFSFHFFFTVLHLVRQTIIFALVYQSVPSTVLLELTLHFLIEVLVASFLC